LLARRTQLFNVKMEIRESQNESLSKLLEFPSLVWVVRDFFQDLGGESPKEWLIRLLTGNVFACHFPVSSVKKVKSKSKQKKKQIKT